MLMTVFIFNLALFGVLLWRNFQLHQAVKLVQHISTELQEQSAGEGHALGYDMNELSEDEFAAMMTMSHKVLDDDRDEQYEAENKED